MNLRKREQDRFREENKRGNDIVILEFQKNTVSKYQNTVIRIWGNFDKI